MQRRQFLAAAAALAAFPQTASADSPARLVVAADAAEGNLGGGDA